MREIFERHAERLTADERAELWAGISGVAVRAPRAIPPRALHLAGALATVTIATSVFVTVQRGPVMSPPARTNVGEVPSKPEPSATADRSRALFEVARPARTAIPRTESGRSSTGGAVGMPTPPRAAVDAGAVTPEAPPAIDVGVIASQATTPPVPVAPKPGALPNTGAVSGKVMERNKQPVAFANVMVLNSKQGTITDDQGNFVIRGVRAGVGHVQVQAIGYDKVVETIEVNAGQTADVTFTMGARSVSHLEEIEVKAERRIDTKSSTTKQSVSAGKLKELPVDNLNRAVATKAGVVARGDELHIRGGRGGEVKVQINGTEASDPLFGRNANVAAPALPEILPTGGTRLPNDEAFDSMFFKNYGVNPFIATDEDALSTFAVDVDAASYTVTRRYLELGHLPPAEAVRVEEFVNFFQQGYPKFQNEDFRIFIDGAPSPFGRGYHLLRMGIKGREISKQNRKAAQLTFVVDVSGSMAREDRLELVKRALRLLVDQLCPGDEVGIIVYGSNGRVVLDPVAMDGEGCDGSAPANGAQDSEGSPSRHRVLQAIESLRPEGATNAEEGLRLGYEMARQNYRPGAINRIVLCSDGVANVGVTGPESMLARVRDEADKGVHLTTVGFGMGNYNDVLMEQLANRGDGNYFYVDDIQEAHRVFVEHLTGTLQTIAKDAKIQVEFDSTRVLRYRLLGFENRDVADRDFRNDRVDAGEIGAGHEVTALYEVKLAPGVDEGTLATVRLRYARPVEDEDESGAPQVVEIEEEFDAADLSRRFEDAAPHFRLDAAVAEFSEILRASYWAKDSRLTNVRSVARSAARQLRDDASAEFVGLVERAIELKRSKADSDER